MAFSSCRKLVLAAAVSTAMALSTHAAEPAGPTPPAATPPAAAPAATSVVVTVNGKPISAGELDKETQGVQMQAARQLPPEAIAQMQPRMRAQALSNLVTRALLLQALVDRKIVVGDDEIKKAVDDVMKNVPPGQTLDEALKHAGFTKEEFMKQITDSLGIKKMFTEETKAVTVNDDDVAKFYKANLAEFKRGESVSARHILIMFGQGDDETKKAEKKKKLEAIRERILKGEDFIKVCAETSEDPGSKDKGGLYENFERGKMVPPFENAAFTQKIGEIGPVVETAYGYHIIKVEKHNEPGTAPLDEAKVQIKPYLENQKKQEAVQKYVKTLHDSAKISYADGFAPAPPASAPTTAPATGATK
jgi:peptidyl-prolyl cis-trans isomerase C